MIAWLTTNQKYRYQYVHKILKWCWISAADAKVESCTNVYSSNCPVMHLRNQFWCGMIFFVLYWQWQLLLVSQWDNRISRNIDILLILFLLVSLYILSWSFSQWYIVLTSNCKYSGSLGASHNNYSYCFFCITEIHRQELQAIDFISTGQLLTDW